MTISEETENADLTEAVEVLKVLVGIDAKAVDADGDAAVTLADAIYWLRQAASE